ncbi:hypothetical protein [Bradyrhizobium macuxiense]|uniref:hypothetical protein n=1 Tax=Bradyrhizobium macuxiense TaxID=1755647 RepID=UPI0011BED208|nr:hypothetical protein [Bradyrhizobium macuxiense]
MLKALKRSSRDLAIDLVRFGKELSVRLIISAARLGFELPGVQVKILLSLDEAQNVSFPWLAARRSTTRESKRQSRITTHAQGRSVVGRRRLRPRRAQNKSIAARASSERFRMHDHVATARSSLFF